MIEDLNWNGVWDDLNDYGLMKDRLVVRPYPSDAPGVEDSIHRTVGDIALVLCAALHEREGILIGATIPAFMGEAWGIPSGELLEAGLRNSMEKDPPRILDIYGVLAYPLGYEGLSLEEFESQGFNSKAIPCLTTESKRGGAMAAFMPGVAKRIAEVFGSDYFLAFTSVHEAMLHPVGEIEPETLQRVLWENIEAMTPEKDVLTHSLYRYFRDEDEIRIFQPTAETKG